MDVNKVCRTCMWESNRPMKSIYTTITINAMHRGDTDASNCLVGNDNESESVELTILSMIAACSSASATDINCLPKQVCDKCADALREAYLFKSQCEKVYKTLKILLFAGQKPISDVGDQSHYQTDGTVLDELLEVNEKFTQTEYISENICDASDLEPLKAENVCQHEISHHQNYVTNSPKCRKKPSRVTRLTDDIRPAHQNRISYVKEEQQKQNCCPICEKEFSRETRLKKHMEIEHRESLDIAYASTNGDEDNECYSCDGCGRFFDNEEDYLQHKDDKDCDNQNVTDSEVSKSTDFGKQMELGGDQTDQTEEDPDNVQDIMDDFEAASQPNLIGPDNHIEIDQTEVFHDTDIESDFKETNECEVNAETDSDYRDVAKKVTKRKKTRRGRAPKPKRKNSERKSPASATASKQSDHHQCPECDKTFTRATHLKRHMTIHSEVRPHSCELCDKKFRRADHLRIHKHHHATVKPYMCDHCQKGYTRSEHLRRHVQARHSGRPPARKEFICDMCQRGFTTAKYLQVHIRSHADRTFDCKFCEVKFDSKSELADHAKCHTNERPYLCSECGLRFVRNDYLVIHMRRHKGEKPYKCRYCNKGFPRATDLTVHERYHTGEKTHLCTICGKGFQRAYNLLVHMRVHTGEKPYQCPHCVKSFAQGNDLKAHVRRHTGERYKCEICGDGFIQGYHLTQHKRNVHGIDMKSHIRRVAKFLPNNEDSTISDSLDAMSEVSKPKIFEDLTNESHMIETHHMNEVQHQILVPISIADDQMAIRPQQTIVMLQMNQSNIKMEPTLEIYQPADEQQFHQMHQ